MLYPDRAGKPKPCKCCGERPAKRKYLFCAGSACESPEKWLAFCRAEAQQAEARNGITNPAGLAIVDEWRGRESMPIGTTRQMPGDGCKKK